MMGIFNFKKEQKEPKRSNILLAMPIFNNGDNYQLDKVIENLKTFWNLDIVNIDGDNEAASFNIEEETIAIAKMDVPVPWQDIEGTAQYAYNWPSALNDLREQSGHTIVAMMTSHNNPVTRFRIMSKVLSSILMTSDAAAIYNGEQSLLIPRRQYLDHVEELEKNGSPVSLWVYIGLRKSGKGNSAYTYGLKSFDKTEIEIINSKLSLEELFDFLFNITSYVIENDITLNSGETVGISAEQKIPVKISKGQFVEGQSLKLEI